jgi:hypothetical protein
VAPKISETIKKLIDSETAKIDIPTLDGQTIRLNCIYKESHSPNFFLVFPPKKLPTNIDLKKPCPISINCGNSALTLTAMIAEINGDRTLELTAKDTVKPESLREYFRINAKLPIVASYEAPSPDSKVPSWTLTGRTLDMSGSGVLAIFPNPPPSNHKLTVTIELANNINNIECLAHVVRSRRLRKASYQISFHFDYVSPKSKDSIISFCLQEQRNQLREKIQTAD